MTNNTHIIVGRIGSPYGVKGWVKVQSFTHPITNIMDYSPWYIKEVDTWVPVTVEDMRIHGKGIVARLPDCHERNRAQFYTQKEIAILVSQLPPLNEGEFCSRGCFTRAL